MAKEKTAPKKEQPKKQSKASGKWAANYFIRGYGRVNEGDAVTAEALAAWNKISKTKPQIEG